MLKELEILISFILDKYEIISLEWENCQMRTEINMKSSLVKNIYIDKDVLLTILNYRTFINNKNLQLSLDFKSLGLNNQVNTRVKSQNSIEFKINNYIQNHNEGENPINKCFNDLFGVRIILEEDLEYNEIREFVENKYLNLKCIDSSKKEGYTATHIYFRRDNYSFPWELQVWNKTNEKVNITSHEKYKQEYTKWEQENKGGESF